MRRILPIILLLVFAAACLSGCRDAETRRTLRKMMGSTVVLPEKVTCVQNGEVFPMPEELRSRPKLIVFVDSTECSKCRIDKLVHYSEMFTLSEETDAFKIMILLSAPRQEYKEIYEHLLYLGNQYPVYLDDDKAFQRINPFIPDKPAFHAMTVNDNNEIVLVGDPVYNKKVVELFNKVFEIKI